MRGIGRLPGAKGTATISIGINRCSCARKHVGILPGQLREVCGGVGRCRERLTGGQVGGKYSTCRDGGCLGAETGLRAYCQGTKGVRGSLLRGFAARLIGGCSRVMVRSLSIGNVLVDRMTSGNIRQSVFNGFGRILACGYS